MDLDERYLMNEEARIEEEYQCDACGKIIDGWDALDPFIIDDRLFCLECASDLTTLRMHEYINGVSDKTKKLKS